MSRAVSIPRPLVGESLLLDCVDWRTYSTLLRAFAERPGVRLTYDRGELEIRSPSFRYDGDGRFLGILVNVLTEELGLPVKSGGSTTLPRRLRKRGIEPDECFWIANAKHMAGKRRLDLETDPPPDLAIEVEVTHTALDRLAIYAALGVPEVWWLRRNKLTFYVLDENTYARVERSRSFPQVEAADLMRFLSRARRAGDENPVVRAFRKWVRTRR